MAAKADRQIALAGFASLGFAAALGAVAVHRGVTPAVAAAGIVALGAAAATGYLLWLADPAWTFSLAVAASIFSGYSGHLHLPIGADRALLAFGLVRLASMAWRQRGRRSTATTGFRLQAVHWLLLAAMAYVVLSALWTGTFATRDGFYAILDRFGAVPFLMFVLAGTVFGTPRQRAILLGTLTVVGAYLGLTALFEVLHLNALVFPRYILDPTVGIHSGRARGPFAEAVANGLGLYACAVSAAVGAATWRGWTRVLALAVALLCGLGIVFTLTRAVWLGAFCATALSLIGFRELRRFLVPVALVGVLGVVVSLQLVPGLAGSIQSREQSSRPVWDRLNTDHAALRMIAARPLLGFGWNTFPTDSVGYLRQEADFPLTGQGIEAHNVFLSHAVELGLVGGALWGLALVLAVGGALVGRAPPDLRLWRIGLFAIAIQWLVVANFGPLPYAFPNLVLWLWAGIVWNGVRARRTARTGASAALRPSRPVLSHA